jgi:HEAT repeat protein
MRYILPTIAATLVLLAGAPALAQKDKADKPAAKNKKAEKDVVLGGKNLKQWIEELRSRDPSIRELAIQTVGMYGQAAQDAGAVGDVLENLNSRDVSLRASAIITLSQIGLDDENYQKGIAALVKALSDNQQIVRYRACMTLGRYGLAAKTAVPALINIVKDQYYASWEVRRAAAMALGTTGYDAKESDPRAIKALTDALVDPCAMVRMEVLSSLYALGPPSAASDKQRTMQSLLNLTNARDKMVAVWAHLTIMRFDKKRSEKHLEAIGKLLRHTESAVRVNAARALGMLGPEARSQVPELAIALKDEDVIVVGWAIAALQAIGKGAQQAVPDLQKLTEHKNQGVQQMAKAAIEVITDQKMDKPKVQGAKPPARPDAP